ncbi:MAG: hypothetical protein PF692_07405 [Kiritimatiellae bacterium]|jgi:hypothetical protein|nr:hypothetical protein [Kiritimatiellia bacterium]
MKPEYDTSKPVEKFVDEGDSNIWIAPHARMSEPLVYTHCHE